jgi:hypothetical protein
MTLGNSSPFGALHVLGGISIFRKTLFENGRFMSETLTPSEFNNPRRFVRLFVKSCKQAT